MKNLSTRLALISIVALVAAGCAQRAPRLESQMGQSLNMLRAQQTLNPRASNNTDPVAGMDARSAQIAHDRYEQSFRTPVAPPPRNAFTIGISSGR
jgi:hypothetical protein